MVKTHSAPHAIRPLEWGSSSAPLAATALEHALISVAEQEQERIGRELHDGLGQELAGAAFLAKALAGKLASLALLAEDRRIHLREQSIDMLAAEFITPRGWVILD